MIPISEFLWAFSIKLGCALMCVSISEYSESGLEKGCFSPVKTERISGGKGRSVPPFYGLK